MRSPDLWTSFFCLATGIFVCVFSYTNLGLGHLYNPGSGLFPFTAGSVMGVLSIFLIWKTLFLKGKRGENKKIKHGYSKAAFVMISLLCYGLLFDPIGFDLSTFMLVLFLLKISGYSWKKAIFWSIIIVGASHITFQSLLELNLPIGFLKMLHM
jgi:putative tricarboxylic transport membrane protein